MTNTFLGSLLCLTLGTALGAHAAPSQSADTTTVAGTWNVSIIGDHVVPVALVLQQDGSTVTGTLMLHGRDIPVEGEYRDRSLRVTAAAEGADGVAHGFGALTITGTMKDDGTLSGEVDGSRGRIPMTAERLKKRG